MKAARFLAPNKTEVTDVATPECGPDDVLIQVKASGICGTDIHILKGEYELAVFPMIPGHEFSGVVAAIGTNVTRFQVGDRVTADPNVPCNRCEACQRNEPNQCENLRAIGVTGDGGFAEYVVAPESVTFSIGDMSFKDAALIEPLACVVWGLQRVQIQAGDRVLMFGAGPMGCLLAQAVAAAGASQVDAVDIVGSRLKMIEELGVTHAIHADKLDAHAASVAPRGYDVVVDVTGAPPVIEGMFQYARPRGKLWQFGVAPDTATVQISPYELFRKDLSYIGSFAVCRTFHPAIMMIKSGKINLDPLVSHQFALDDFDEGLRVAQEDPSRMKVQFSLE